MIANNPAPLARTASLDDTMRLAETFCRSGFFSDAREAAQAVVKIIAGQELGFGPMASMTGVHVIKGKVALSSNLLGAAIKRSGRYDYRVIVLTDERAELAFFEAGQQVGASAFTMDDAKRAGLLANPTWKNYPRNMLLARALSNGARWYCPDVFGGAIYTPDELGATVDGETGDVIDATPRADSRPTLPASEAVAPEPAPAKAAAPAAPATADGWRDRIAAADGDARALAGLWREVAGEPNAFRQAHARAAIAAAFAPAITARAAEGLDAKARAAALGLLADMGVTLGAGDVPAKARRASDDAAALVRRAHAEVEAVEVVA